MDLKQFTADGQSRVSDFRPLGGLETRSIRERRGLTKIQLSGMIFLAWTIVGAIETLPELVKGSEWYALVAKMLGAWAWVILMPALLFIDKKLHSRTKNIWILVFSFFVLAAPFTLLHTYLTAVLLYPIPLITWNPLRTDTYTVYFHIDSWTHYCAIVGILQAIRFYNSQLRLERVERSLSEWRLNALRLHLEPHFLFNALNAISSEIVKRPRLAQDMIADLGTLLRLSLDSKTSPEVTLEQELTLLDHYLSIQKIRFGKRIDIQIEIEPDTLLAKVPSMLFQPLVENAIRHGVEGKRTGGKIAISASKMGNRLRLCVADNGRGLPPGWNLEGSTGHGLGVTWERLVALYPSCREDCLKVERRAEGGTEVVVRLPFFEAR